MNFGDLKRQIEQKKEKDRQEDEKKRQESLENYNQQLAKDYRNARNTIENDTAEFIRKMKSYQKSLLWMPGAIALSLLLGSSIGSWGMSQYLTAQGLEIQSRRQEIKALKAATGGWKLYEGKDAKYLILPPNSTIKAEWKCQGKPCIKL